MLGDAGPRATQSKFRLLYFGGDMRLIAALPQALTKPDYQLVTSSNYDDTILFLKSRIPYSLLLIDFEWRETEGLKLARRARSIRHRKRMSIVFVTSTEPGSDTKMLAQKAGVNECVAKTLDMGAVIETIRGLTMI